ncbi:chemotaxis protein MotB [Sphingomonas vulcanisoli]|uniref:Chemotaxis protein MotB n=1 Tax=Sphingomonas vulcanisoli TaxID=1658060 RepID=A0ABX0TX75_9SPHN|nr:flagellar motor protein MotB [Sphingomonas vulcanisoli]NIJ09000.1 chemotaxis protein MotB [Sphingomonas vulcanisoli]
MAAPNKRGKNEPEPRPIIVKKIYQEAHAGHHGGAWKVAYADFVTAMMAFFLLLWILGATTEKQRKGIADYFTPTLVEMREKSAGSNGVFGGDSLMAKDNYPHSGGVGSKSMTIPRDAIGGPSESSITNRAKDQQRFGFLKRQLVNKLSQDKAMKKFMSNIRFTDTPEGLRIDLIDKADFAMFGMGTDKLVPEAYELMGKVAQVIQGAPNGVIVRGHTDALPYAAGRSVNNWTLSSARAEATRKALADQGVPADRFARIEGVADREPFIAADRYDPRNRRMSITLTWSADQAASAPPGLTDKSQSAHLLGSFGPAAQSGL